MRAKAIGIDLGTATSEIAIFHEGRPHVIPDPDSPTRGLVVPSIVAVDRKGRLLAGLNAQSFIDLPGHGVRQVKRLMGTSERVTLGERELRPQEISALLLRHLKAGAEKMLGAEVRQVVLSVPANFPDAARQATRDSAELAGLEVVKPINEPTAAALAFGVRHTQTEGQVVVFDFGGGTLDITVLEMMEGVLDVQASYGDPMLGGKDFDDALVEFISARFTELHPSAQPSMRSRYDLRSAAEAGKVSLSNHDSTVVRCASYATLEGRPVDLEIEVTKQDFERAVQPLLDKARKCLERALSACKIRPDGVDHVLLVGGTTYVPAVRALVADFFGKEPRSDVDPDLAVAQGAATEAGLLAGLVPDDTGPILTDVCSFGLGVQVMGLVGRHVVTNLYDALIPPNTTIPFSVKRTYSLVTTEQKSVEISLYQDHFGTATTVEDAQPTGLSARIDDIPLAANGQPHPVEVEFSYDRNGLVHLAAAISATGQEARVTSFADLSRRLDSPEKAEARQQVEEIWKTSSIGKRFQPLLRRAEKMVPYLGPEDRRRVNDVGRELHQALVNEDEENAERAGDKLTDLLLELD